MPPRNIERQQYSSTISQLTAGAVNTRRASLPSMSAARPSVAPPDPSTIDHFVYLRVGWQDYEKLLAMRGERSVPRITYLKGLVELMSPSRYHEIDKKRFARLLEAWSEIAGVPLEGYGSWTLKDEKEDRGAEADECTRCDASQWTTAIGRTSPSRWSGPPAASTSSRCIASSASVRCGSTSAAALRFFTLRVGGGEEAYVDVARSELLPELPIDLLLACMKQPSQTAAIRALRESLAALAPPP